MKKRLLCLLLAILFIFTAAPFAPALESEYPDDEFGFDPYGFQEHLEIEAMEHDAEIEAFNLALPTTRERAAVYLVMAHSPILLTSGTIPGNRFNDVAMSRWSFPAIAWAANQSWVLGTGDGNFAPVRNVTREEYAVMLVRAFRPSERTGQLTFSDRNQISSWAQESVRLAVAHGWILGHDDGTFRPQDTITREHAIMMTNRAPGANITDPTPRTITWNANGGTSVVSWERLQGHAIGPLPSPTRAGLSSTRWFNTAATTGGTQILTSTRMPNANATYVMRWHDTDRHINMWYHSTTVRLRNPNFSASAFQTGVQNAVNAWNGATDNRISFGLNTTSNNTVSTRGLTATGAWGRVFLTQNANRRVTRFDIELNTDRIRTGGPGVMHLTNVVTSVMSHELGHVVGLEDNPRGRRDTIMFTDRNRNSLTTPTAFDVQSVHLLY